MVHGSLGADYDLIVAVRQKDTSSNHHDYANFESSNTKIHKHINLSRNVCVVAIRVCYERNGEIVWGSKNGGTGACKTDKVVFDYPSEILTHLTGYMGPTMIMGPSVVKSLTFHTTKGKYGPYGEEEGEFFSTKLKEGSIIVGFHGRRGLFLDAIGVHVLEGKVANSSPAVNAKTSASGKVANVSPTANDKHSASKATNQAALVAKKAADGSEWPFKFDKRGQTDEVVHPAPYGPGPLGGEGGKPCEARLSKRGQSENELHVYLHSHFIVMEPPSRLLRRSAVLTILHIAVVVGWALLHTPKLERSISGNSFRIQIGDKSTVYYWTNLRGGA
ncbi:hypothetical protein SASPL_116195 [Salvia splendens]|uniref:Jacalin-type lectin domain-containing protein n=1 Tax=Salvia splendens TaxID=180675 RepID=A0A8X8XY99_SALSN|nr:hypothetical protein SASPL_116195 [Salvia splendens]